MLTKLLIEDVNRLQFTEFVALFKNAVELWPDAAETVVLSQPFASVDELVSHFITYLTI